jgi:predicted dehydrogenase
MSRKLSDTPVPTSQSAPQPPALEEKEHRRAFLNRGVSMGGTMAATSLLARSVHAQGSEEIKVGLIGCGGRGRGAAQNAINADPATKVTAIGDMFDRQIELTKNQFEKQMKDRCDLPQERCFVGWDAYQKVIDSGVDMVILTSPPHFRPQHLEAALRAGKHVFCEKPVAVDPTGVRKVLELTEQARIKGLSLVSGLCWRYDLGVKETVHRLLDGAIGEILNTQANYLTSTLWQKERQPDWTDMHYQLANWLYFRWLSGDHINEQFIHSLDKALWLRNDTPPVKCYGMGGRQVRTSPSFGDVYDHFYVVYEWANGSRTYAATRQMEGCFNEVEDFIYGTKGTARVLAYEILGPRTWKYKFDGGDNKPSMYDLEHVALIKGLRDGKPLNNGVYMSYSTMMAIMGREACYSGRTITWEQAMKSEQDFTPPAYAFGPAPEVVVHQPGTYRFT